MLKIQLVTVATFQMFSSDMELMSTVLDIAFPSSENSGKYCSRRLVMRNKQLQNAKLFLKIHDL